MFKKTKAGTSADKGAFVALRNAQRVAPQFRYRNRNHRRAENAPNDLQMSQNQTIWSEHLKTLLEGIQDDSSFLSILRGHEDTILQQIYSLVVQSWRSSITQTTPAHRVGRMQAPSDASIPDQDFATRTRPQRDVPVRSVLLHRGRQGPTLLGPRISDRPQIAFTPCGKVEFPPPKDRSVNMLPFIMGIPETIPEFLKEYYPLVEACPMQESELGKVCYLTVTEGLVEASKTQRRAGLHIEAPNSKFRSDPKFVAALEHSWGMGMAFSPDELHGGIYIASNMAESCAVWNALVDKSAGSRLGGIDHLRPWLGSSSGGEYRIPANELVWITDRTPHEALSQAEEGYRQFFRVVTSEISVWYADHSTANPLVPLPDHVQVIHGSKFDSASSTRSIK